MPIPVDWDVVAAIRRCERSAWQGDAWRIHRERYRADDPGGSLRASGRYHRGIDLFPLDRVFAALYLALSPETALAELIRHVTPDLIPALNSYRLTRLSLLLDDVFDLRDPNRLGIEMDALCSDRDHDLTWALGQAAFESGAEAILIHSATRLGDNLVVFPANLQTESRIELLDFRHPRLYVPNEPWSEG